MREADEAHVPIESAAGTCAIGKNAPNTGIIIRLAPPPQTALSENARKARKKRSIKMSLFTKQVYSLTLNTIKIGNYQLVNIIVTIENITRLNGVRIQKYLEKNIPICSSNNSRLAINY